VAETLIVAAGGGGDAITAVALASALNITRPVILTYSWDRLMVDPVPGPRSAAEFAGLSRLAPHVIEVVPSATSVAPASSSLPRLAGDLPARLLLLDPAGGAAGMAAQIRSAADLFQASGVAILDVGGDVLTDGADPGLRSPLADQLALAACVRSGVPARLMIAAPGIDGELPPEVILHRLGALAAQELPHLSDSDVAPVRHVFRWHPSEASGLLTAAAGGCRGLVEVRDAGDQVLLSDQTTALFAADAQAALEITPAARLLNTRSLKEAEAIIREATGISEIRYEAGKAARLRDQPARAPSPVDLPVIDAHARDARERGAQFISTRRLAELLHATTLDAFAGLCDLLAEARPGHYEPSLYRTEPRPGSRSAA
jgi:hypothetical protein